MANRANQARRGLRIGAVGYLNAKPLVWRLASLLPEARISVDLPSRLADGLACGRLDVALVPSIETVRRSDWVVVSDACVACDGPVRSVELVGFCPVERIRRLAVDEGSRTSAALARIVLAHRYGVVPEICTFPIGAAVEDCQAEGVVVIGDRAMRLDTGRFHFVWDLGQLWRQWTGLPFVFAMWTARAGFDAAGLADVFSTARDQGVARIEQIARDESGRLGMGTADCLAYLTLNLRYRLGRRERRGLEAFAQLATQLGLVTGKS
ncbi:MAG TPA: hypothetical protein EYP56_14705 [Planctomycetaceae bacterium]|nr:hypothetical protein [Planctomycetaceae bacterium]